MKETLYGAPCPAEPRPGSSLCEQRRPDSQAAAPRALGRHQGCSPVFRRLWPRLHRGSRNGCLTGTRQSPSLPGCSYPAEKESASDSPPLQQLSPVPLKEDPQSHNPQEAYTWTPHHKATGTEDAERSYKQLGKASRSSD